MRRTSLAFLAAVAISQPVFASTWNFMWVGNDATRFFFDADTVERRGEITLLWIKTVQTKAPMSDGSWARASKWRINCSKRTLQTLSSASYDKDGQFLKSYSNVSSEDGVIPDSTGEGVLKLACEVDFPKSKNTDNYFKVSDNDVFRATRTWVEVTESQKDPAPK